MKKILLICMLMVSTFAVFSSCRGVDPNFNLKVDLNGDVVDSTTNINGEFLVYASNVDTVAFACLKNSKILSIESPQGKDANEWFDNYIQENVISQFNSSTEYTIHVKGYVREESTGITFSVDKTFTNKAENL